MNKLLLLLVLFIEISSMRLSRFYSFENLPLMEYKYNRTNNIRNITLDYLRK